MFAGPVNATFAYYFLINASNSSVAPYPVPVGAPVSGTTYGNGFATASDNSSGGFTDFVLFSSKYQYAGSQPNQGFALYHVAATYPQGVNNSGNFVANGSPIQVASPLNSGNPNAIAFQIDLAQLFEYPNSGNSQQSAINQALNLRWIQVNIVSTDFVPTDIQSGVIKHFDSFGDDSNGVGGYLLANLIDGPGAYADGAGNPTSLQEPTGDVFISGPSGGGTTNQIPGLDLVHWTIQIITAG
jgi:hypothetical protein